VVAVGAPGVLVGTRLLVAAAVPAGLVGGTRRTASAVAVLLTAAVVPADTPPAGAKVAVAIARVPMPGARAAIHRETIVTVAG
jgi:hypothetical protein